MISKGYDRVIVGNLLLFVKGVKGPVRSVVQYVLHSIPNRVPLKDSFEQRDRLKFGANANRRVGLPLNCSCQVFVVFVCQEPVIPFGHFHRHVEHELWVTVAKLAMPGYCVWCC